MRIAGRQLSGRLVIAGVGNRDRADDGFGPALARRLRSGGWDSAIDCGDRLEDFTLDIASKSPETILVADAVEMSGRPGEVALLEVEDLPPACHPHAPSLRIAMEYLKARTGANVVLLAVQPGRVADGRGLSPEVETALDRMVETLTGRPPARGENDREDEWTP
jgi:hydrogenase maturation protease